MSNTPASSTHMLCDPVRQSDYGSIAEHDPSPLSTHFITLCTRERLPLLGEIVDREMRLSSAGEMVASTWIDLPSRFPFVALEDCVVMPDHMHAIVLLKDGTDSAWGHGTGPAPTLGLV